MTLRERLTALSHVGPAETPVVSVYLNTRWADEQQRDRVRAFLKTELGRARAAAESDAFREDLDWIAEQGDRLIGQAERSEAHGVALFACRSRGQIGRAHV